MAVTGRSPLHIVQSWVRAILPAPRRALRLVQCVPLLGFLLLFGGTCLFLEWTQRVHFSRPGMFWLLLLAPWMWWLSVACGGGLVGWRNPFALIVRLCLLGVFIAALADPRAVRHSDRQSIMYALDVSDSMNDSVRDRALRWIMDTVVKKPEKDQAGLLVFGADSSVELPPRTIFPYEALNSRVPRDGTDIGKALNLAAAMISEGDNGRIVLISDGNETDGTALAAADRLKAMNLPVDVLPVQFEYAKEAWLERLDLPRRVKLGETYETNVLLNSLHAGRGKLTLQENGQTIFEKEITFEAGRSRYQLPLPMRQPGFYEYAARLDVPEGEDGWKENNVALGSIYLKGEGKVLLVTDAQGDVRNWERLVEALKATERIVQVRYAHEFPRDPRALLPYDMVMFAEVASDAFDPLQLQAMRDAVAHQGLGFVMLGGVNSFGPGGYHRTPIEEILPVSMDVSQKKMLPKAALVIVLHTCEFAQGNTWAKKIAKAAIKVLSGRDEVGLLHYGQTGMAWVFPLTPASEQDNLATLINKAEPGDMPDFQTGMQMAHTALQANDAAVKHLIIISDGDPSPPTPGLLNQYVADRITASMVAINPHGGQEVGLMRAIAERTGGRYYFAGDPSQLPAIFIKEAKSLQRAMLQNREFVPLLEFPSPILKGIDAMPPLKGYVLTTAKPRSSVVLRVPIEAGAPEGDLPDPLLATWRFGLGTTAAWTSDLGPAWAANWMAWEKLEAFLKQFVTEVSRVERESTLEVRTVATGNTATVEVEDSGGGLLELDGRVTGPHGEPMALEFAQTSPRRYMATFPVSGKGRYQVVVAGQGTEAGKDRTEEAISSLSVPYSAEYLRFRSDTRLLREIAERTGGRILSPSDVDLYSLDRKPRQSSREIFDWFLLALCILVPLDVAVRRVQLDWAAIFAKFRPKKTTSTETMGALLRRKEGLHQPPSERSEEKRPAPAPMLAPIPISKPPDATAKPPTPKPPPPSPGGAVPPPADGQPPAQPDGESGSTMERLLARKRKRQDGP